MPVAIQPHDPQALRTYGLYWGDALVAGDSLASCAWTVPAGLTIVSQGVNADVMEDAGVSYPAGTVAWLRVSTAEPDTDYDCICHVVTVGGDEDERTLRIAARQR